MDKQVATPDYRPMEVIIKPTIACNFKCSFCSSVSFGANPKDLLDLDVLFDFLKRFPNTRTIIVNGGDPTMVKPSYYLSILEFLEQQKMDTILSLTTNLWDFYKNPNKWAELFRHKQVGIGTSFNYGDGRRKPDFKQYTCDDFWEVSNMMLDIVGYRPDFISVITDENEDEALKNVYLAKEMSKTPCNDKCNPRHKKDIVVCKLNYAMASGAVKEYKTKDGIKTMGQEGKPYLLADIYEIYVKIAKLGLEDYEFNTKQMMGRLAQDPTMCPQNRTCDEGIRCIQPMKKGDEGVAGKYFSCGSFGDDVDKYISFEDEIYGGKFFKPLQSDPYLFSLKKSCLSCPMFLICNGCRKTVKDLKQSKLVERHCYKMKGMANEIIALNKIKAEPTPYIQEYFDQNWE